jgi:hypothetical protein
MNRFLGFMNALLLATLIVTLVVMGGGVEQKTFVLGAAVSFVPIVFTMLACEPAARFLRTAIATNVLLIAVYIVGTRSAAPAPPSPFILPFVINIIGLTVIGFRVRRARREAAYGAVDGVATPVEESVPAPEDPDANYFVRHWRGELSLPMSYWINGWGATLLLSALIFVANKVLDDVSLRAAAAAAIGLNALLLLATCWSSVGTWRSAGYHVARGGASGWAVTVQVLVVLGAIGTVTNFFLYVLPQMKEHTLIALDRDPMGHIAATPGRDGHSIMLSGAVGAGSAGRFEDALDGAPGVTTIMLESGGGRIEEAVRIARMIRERKLNTYVESHCESACTLILLAGTDRAATTRAQIGFHRASSVGSNPQLDAAVTEEMIEKYRQAGLSDDFLARIRETSATDMWYPTGDELLAARVVNRVSFGGEVARVAKYDSRAYLAFQYAGDPIMAAINDHFGGAVDAAAASAWELYQSGASEAAMWAAARRVILSYYGRLLRTADDASLRTYLQIRLDQLRAARELSEEACALVANSGLDVGQVLPRELYMRELTWVQQAIAKSDRPPVPAVNRQEYAQIVRRLAERLPPDAPAIVKNPAAHADRPGLLCSGTLQFYEAVRALPQGERAIVLRGLFQT